MQLLHEKTLMLVTNKKRFDFQTIGQVVVRLFTSWVKQCGQNVSKSKET